MTVKEQLQALHKAEVISDSELFQLSQNEAEAIEWLRSYDYEY